MLRESLADIFSLEAELEPTGQIGEVKANAEILAGFIRQLGRLGAEATEFSEEAWGGLIDHMTVYAKDNIEVTFIGGFSVTVR